MSSQKEQTKQSDMGDIIEKVETFIRRLRNLDFVIDSKSTSLRYSIDGKYGFKEDIGNLPDLLAKSILEYELYRQIPNNKLASAYKCSLWVDRAILSGIVKEGEGLENKLKECSEENNKLRKELETTSNSLMRAKEKIEELEQIIPNAGSENA